MIAMFEGTLEIRKKPENKEIINELLNKIIKNNISAFCFTHWSPWVLLGQYLPGGCIWGWNKWPLAIIVRSNSH